MPKLLASLAERASRDEIIGLAAPLVQYALEGLDAFTEKKLKHCRKWEFAMSGETALILSVSMQECIGSGNRRECF
jgi:hypothetical protein